MHLKRAEAVQLGGALLIFVGVALCVSVAVALVVLGVFGVVYGIALERGGD